MLPSQVRRRARAPSNSTETPRTITVNNGTLAGCENIFITGGTFVSPSTANHGIHELLQAMSSGAIHDSAELANALSFAGAFRTTSHRRVRDEIEAWIRDPHPEHPMLWLSGESWAGATTMLREIADDLSSQRQGLGAGNVVASFFFNKALERGASVTHLPSTISYQLAVNIPGMRQIISRIMDDNPALPSKTIERQLDSLVISPFRILDFRLHPSPTPTVVIGSLDQCHGPGNQRRLLEAIFGALHAHRLPLRFVISSAPNPDISEFFELQDISQRTRRIDLDQALRLDVEDELYAILFRLEDPLDGNQGTWIIAVLSLFFFGQPRDYTTMLRGMWIDGRLQNSALQQAIVNERRTWIIAALCGGGVVMPGAISLCLYWRDQVPLTWQRLTCNYILVFLGIGLSAVPVFLLRRIKTTDSKAVVHGIRSLCKQSRSEMMAIILSFPIACVMWSPMVHIVLAIVDWQFNFRAMLSIVYFLSILWDLSFVTSEPDCVECRRSRSSGMAWRRTEE